VLLAETRTRLTRRLRRRNAARPARLYWNCLA